jgi:hypothetical protein
MISLRELEALINLAQRASKSQAEELWLTQLIDKINRQLAKQCQVDEEPKENGS